MRFSTFSCFALATATLLQPVISGNVRVEPSTPSLAIDESDTLVNSVVLVREALSTTASDGGMPQTSYTSINNLQLMAVSFTRGRIRSIRTNEV